MGSNPGPRQREHRVLTTGRQGIPKKECFLIFKFIFIGVQLIYNVVLVSAVQQSESVIHMHISTLFQILFPYRSLESIEQSFLCYTVGPYLLSILYIIVCICQSRSPNLSVPNSVFFKKLYLAHLPQLSLFRLSQTFNSELLKIYIVYNHQRNANQNDNKV